MCTAERIGRELKRKALLCGIFHTLTGAVICICIAFDADMGEALRVDEIAVILGCDIGTIPADLAYRLVAAAVTVGMTLDASAQRQRRQLVTKSYSEHFIL